MAAGSQTQRWSDDLAGELSRSEGGSPPRLEAFLRRLPPGYTEETAPVDAAWDLVEVSRLGEEEGAERLCLRPVQPGAAGDVRLRRYGRRRVELSSFLPIVESFGLAVVEAVPWRFGSVDGSEEGSTEAGAGADRVAWLDDLALRVDTPVLQPFDNNRDGERLVEAIRASIDARAEVDTLNRLVVAAGLDWRQVAVLRTYRRYHQQAGEARGEHQLEDALVQNPGVARALVELFVARFAPDLGSPGSEPRAEAMASARRTVLGGLAAVPDLEHDRVLRLYLALIEASVRTNWFCRDGASERRPTIAVKLQSAKVPGLPAPCPYVETFVHAPAMEGIHLRFGPIARGGLRWSDRQDDLRTEILDLAKAQVKKNAVIVPTGAKGGFVIRHAAARSGAPVQPEEVRHGYQQFVESLLDVTDNLVGGNVVHPEGVICHDGDDPYLVVAADKGTATFSDLANSVSEARRFWLGDAFASGGSRGYDHKAMGITARGAWVAVRRHFRQLGVDVQSEPIRVVGVGDMSGDVFGNGMLQSRAIHLVAAFDHRDIFVDPTPDAERAYAERQRLAELAGSSWKDYDPDALSPGGAVVSRRAKEVDLPDQARAALGLGPGALSAPDLVSAILAAPADLLWFGGIGTFVKAPGESNAEVGDHANDGVRVTSDQVRARVIAEGGNLGITQRARIRYSRRGGRINADFIDNAAGVATSDREVNLKILLGLAIEEGLLVESDRDELLAAVEDEVAASVLGLIDNSVASLSRAVPASADDLPAYEALIEHLAAGGRLERSVEALPDADELARRREAGAGLIRPELAVLLAFAKSDLVEAVETSPLSTHPALAECGLRYFPSAIAERFAGLVPRHRLYPQLVATELAGEIVDRMGITWAHETAAETGRTLPEVAAAYWAAREVLDLQTWWGDLDASVDVLSADAEEALIELMSDTVGGLARAYLARPTSLDLAAIIAADRTVAHALEGDDPSDPDTADRVQALQRAEVDEERAAHFGRLVELARVAEVAALGRATGVAPQPGWRALQAVDVALGLRRVQHGLVVAGGRSRWARWASRNLADELAELRVRAAAGVLSETTNGPDPWASGTEDVGAAAARWAKRRRGALERVARLTARLDDPGPDALALVTLAVRAIAQAVDQ
jgi:glutamate dehydrogenase